MLALGNFTALGFRFAAYIAGAMLVGMSPGSTCGAFVATRLGDPTPRLWGRLSWNPRSWFDPFGVGARPRPDLGVVGDGERPVSAARRLREAGARGPCLSQAPGPGPGADRSVGGAVHERRPRGGRGHRIAAGGEPPGR